MKEGKISVQGMLIEPLDEALFNEYWQYPTKRVKEIYDRFNTLQHQAKIALDCENACDRPRLEKIQRQAQKRCRVATLVIGARAQDNHVKPPTQFIHPKPFGIGFGLEM